MSFYELPLHRFVHHFRRLALAAALVLLGAGSAQARSVTFAFISDPQIGGVPDRSRQQGRAPFLTAMPTVAAQQGWSGFDFLLIGGDLADIPSCAAWTTYRDAYEPLRNTSIGFPVYPVLGNHDEWSVSGGHPWVPGSDTEYCPQERVGAYQRVRNQMRAFVLRNHGNRNLGGAPGYADADAFRRTASFAFEVEGVHFLGLENDDSSDENRFPDTMTFLRSNLARVGPRAPVVIFMHFGFDTISADGHWWSEAQRAEFLAAIAPYNVVALLTGHHHAWSPYVMRPGGSRSVWPTFTGTGEVPFQLFDFNGGAWNHSRGYWLFHIDDTHMHAKALHMTNGSPPRATVGQSLRYRIPFGPGTLPDGIEEVPGRAITGHNDRILYSISKTDCATRCLQMSTCRSADYVLTAHRCQLSSESRDTVPGSFGYYSDHVYLHRRTGAAAQFSETPGYAITGFNDSILYGQSKAQCAEACIADPLCLSADYVVPARRCQLSHESRDTQPSAYRPHADHIYLHRLGAR